MFYGELEEEICPMFDQGLEEEKLFLAEEIMKIKDLFILSEENEKEDAIELPREVAIAVSSHEEDVVEIEDYWLTLIIGYNVYVCWKRCSKCGWLSPTRIEKRKNYYC